MSKRTSKRDAAKRLIPLGAVAIAAGCGGGAHSALPAQNDASSPSQTQHAMTTAMLTVQIPARGTQKAKRAPKYISQGSAAIGYSIAASGSAQPAEAVTALPSPGPVATSVTLPVTAPVGTDTVAVHIYDAVPSPGASATPNVLSEGTATATVAAGQSSPLNVNALGVAAGLSLSGSGATLSFFQNHPVAQATTIPAVPVDADGYTITGTLANPVALTVPSGFTASPAAVASAGPVTVTYAAGSTQTGGAIGTGLPLDTAGSADVVTLAPMQLAFVETTDDATNSAVYIDAVNPVTQAQTVSGVISSSPAFSFAAVAGCATGETVVEQTESINGGNSQSTMQFTIASPTTATAPAASDISAIIAPNQMSVLANGLAADSSCGMYSASDATLTRYSGFPNVTGSPIATSGWLQQNSLGVSGTTVYGTSFYETTPGDGQLGQIYAQSVSTSGGAATNLGNIGTDSFDIGVLVGGVNVYDASLDCSGSSPVGSFTQLSGGVAPYGGTYTPDSPETDGAAAGPDGTIYVFVPPTSTSSHLRARLAKRTSQISAAFAGRRGAAAKHGISGMRSIKSGTGNVVTVPGTFGAVSADGRFLAVLSGGDTTAVTVQFYTLAGGTPSAFGNPVNVNVPTGQDIVNITFPK